MVQSNVPSGTTRMMNRIHARLAARGRATSRFAIAPEPRSLGSMNRGQQLTAGNFLFEGNLVTAPETSIWDIKSPSIDFEQALHGFAWLDDLGALSSLLARDVGASWVWGWIKRYGRGKGIGWSADLTGRRVLRWINHGQFLLATQDGRKADLFFQSLVQQARFLSKRWHTATPGLPRFEALTGLIYASYFLEGLESLAAPALQALAQDCRTEIDQGGGISSRNPEELLLVFTQITWVAALLKDLGLDIPDPVQTAINVITPTLRSLRHVDRSLARFHGGGRGPEGWLDQALASSGVRARMSDGLAMGYARLSGGRTSIVVDAAPPPQGIGTSNAHASTLGFELSTGRRPLIVNCGSGVSFGGEWRRAGRATPSHTTLCLDGLSSARLASPDKKSGHEMLMDGPTRVPIELSEAIDGHRFQAGHNGYVASHGLTHARMLELTFDGRGLAGEDMLFAIEPNEQKTFDNALRATQMQGVPFDIRFHLHPDVTVMLDMGGAAASLMLKSGELWVFRSEALTMRLEPSVFLEFGRIKPRATQQIVLSGRATEYGTRIRWSLAKPQDGAPALRDLAQDDLELP